ncbi:hypothetical protein [Tautonia sociabilis]|uniref:Uncharacterized protein n=1 Tax=Tautonia sociabilis TaxID=2080755 RepID=A0A432MH94_9BACT|nr:hypothetical protein [Tautonia sociabilis]RUL86315.1 hypothetical protein TsocGM_16435 [Tautonia sociabilis]
MRIGHRRGLGLAVALLGVLASEASAGGIDDLAPWVHTIPRVTYARDLRTGAMYMAPPIPYGHYAKDHLGRGVGLLHGSTGMLHGKLIGLKDTFSGGHGGLGLGLGHDGLGLGHGHDGLGGGHVLGSGPSDGDVHGASIGQGGHGLAGSGLGHGEFLGTPQGVVPPCDPSSGTCRLGDKHGHGGLGGLFGHGHALHGGHGLSHGDGFSLGHGDGHGHGHGHGTGGLLDPLGHLKGAGHNALGYLNGLHPGNKVRYFVGPGGPVPLTPGYVPYIVPTRSPRDFFAFPPYSTRAMD